MSKRDQQATRADDTDTDAEATGEDGTEQTDYPATLTYPVSLLTDLEAVGPFSEDGITEPAQNHPYTAPADTDNERLDDGHPRWAVIASSGSSRSYHRNAGTVDDPEPACSAVLHRDSASWIRIDRTHRPFNEPCQKGGCFGEEQTQRRVSYTVSKETCVAINHLYATTNLSWRQLANRTGVPQTTARRHILDACWHDTGRHHTRGSGHSA